MSKKRLRSMVAGLALLNLITIVIFAIWPMFNSRTVGGGETVAQIGDVGISRESWINELEQRYGKDVLKEMVDEEVVKQMAEKYDVSVTDQEIEREYKIMKTLYGTYEQSQSQSEDQRKAQIKADLLLEEILTKDVSISETEIKNYYNDNQDLFRIPTTYRISHLTTATKSEADKVMKELTKGVSFQVLAMEKSLDEFTANQGGAMGFISEDNERVPKVYIETAASMKTNDWSKPIQIEEGWAVLYLHEKIKGEQFSYDEVKQQIRRQLAMEHIQTSVSSEIFWDELEVEWFYGAK
ncbi:peptidyl-prolyl cis-trans isomerase [Peribacillus asahii]|nr:peptidyl-prolyl cis-trans isomerase [Peribacillus asahii]USK85258.1 peptidyl-prolyl cis-trans isomerase [Peribacillus asahii]